MQLIMLVQVFTLIGGIHFQEPVILADSLDTYYGSTTFLLLDDGILLYVNSDEQIYRLDIRDPSSAEPFNCSWETESSLWSRPSNTLLHAISQDGSHICFTQQVHFPDSLQLYEREIPGPVAVVVSNQDGSDARIVALSFDVGGAPSFNFTGNSEYLFGGPLMGCMPTPDEFAEYVISGGTPRISPGYLIDVESGARTGEGNSLICDGSSANPWSDIALAGEHPPTMIVDVFTQEILVQDSSHSSSGIIDSWILPDAALADRDGTQIILYTDGREVENLGSYFTIYSALPDGRYLFNVDKREGTPLLLGNIDWDWFGVLDVNALQGLEDYSLSYCDVLTDADDQWLIFVDRHSLYSYELP